MRALLLALVLPLRAAASPTPPEPDALERASEAALRGPPGCTRWSITWEQQGRIGFIPFEAKGTATGTLDQGRWSQLTVDTYTHGNAEVSLDLGAGALPFLPPLVGAVGDPSAPDSLFGELVALVSGDATTLDLAPGPDGGWIETRGLREGGLLRRNNTVIIHYDPDLKPRVWYLQAHRTNGEGPGRLHRANVTIALNADGSPRAETLDLRARLLLALVLERTLVMQPLGPCP